MSADRSPPPSGYLLGTALLLAVIFLVVGAAPRIVALRGIPVAPSEKGPFVEQGYAQIVDKIFVERHWIEAATQTQAGAADGSSPIGPPVQTTDELPDSGAVRLFMRLSHLDDDLQAKDASRWIFSGNRLVGVSESAHTSAGPFADAAWRGHISYATAPPASGVLLQGEGLPPLALAQWSPEDATAGRRSDGSFDLTASGSSAPPPATRLELEMNGVAVAQVLSIGDQVVVRNVAGDTTHRLFVGAFAFDPQQTGYWPLRPGAELRIVTGDQAISLRLQNAGAGSNLIEIPADPAVGAPGFDPPGLATQLSEAMETTMGRGGSQLLASTAVHTTLDAQLQQVLQSELERICAALKLQQKAQGPTFVASATILDAKTGAVLALASYPASASDLSARERGQPASRALLQRNFNFEPLPIGSTAKPIFTAAMLSANFRMAQFRAFVTDTPGAPGEHPFRRVLGRDLGRIFHDTEAEQNGKSDGIDLNWFIQESSDRYAAALMLAAAAPDPTAVGDGRLADGAAVDGQWYGFCGIGAAACPHLHTLPPLVFDSPNGGAALSDPIGRFTRLPWVGRMTSLYGVQTDDLGEQPDTDTSIWSPLSERLGGDAALASDGPFHGVSPAITNLGLDALNSPGNDYISLILGGGRSRWTTIKLAESYARIVTGLNVSATLAQAPDENNQITMPAVAQPLRGAGAVLAPLRTAMTLVTQMQDAADKGTAYLPLGRTPNYKALTAPLAGARIVVFSKTGTPALEQSIQSPAGAAMDELIRRGVLTLDDNDLLEVHGGRQGEPLARQLGRVTHIADVLAPVGVDPLVRRIGELNRQPWKLVPLLVFDDRQQLKGLLPDENHSGETGSVYVMVVGRYPQGAPFATTSPAAALAIAINIQARPRKSADKSGPNQALVLLADPKSRLLACVRQRLAPEDAAAARTCAGARTP